jgi:hypothetical protein
MKDLRDGKEVRIGSRNDLRLGWIEKRVTPTMLISIGPGVLLESR